MAIPEKRQLGSAVLWCGSLVFALGALVVPADKRAQASKKLQLLVDGELVVGDLPSLNGLLEFIRQVLKIGKHVMYGMYYPMRKGGEVNQGPQTKVQRSSLILQQSQAWISRLSGNCAASVLAASQESYVIPADAVSVVMYSDACKEGDEFPGLGGFYAGYWWSFQLGADWDDVKADLTIPALELLAFIINLMVVYEHWRTTLVDHADVLIAFVDAQAAAVVVVSQGPNSLVMMFLISQLRKLECYKKLLPKLAMAHTYGDGNGPADWASRGQYTKLRQYCAQLRLVEHRLPVSAQAVQLIQDTATFVREMNSLYE